MKWHCQANQARCGSLLRLLMVFLLWRSDSACGTSLMKRIRDRQNADDSLRGLDISGETWIRVPPAIQDVLMSIDDKLRSLDTFSYTLKLARFDFSLEQLVRRMENVESKLGRLETKFDVRMEKVEEAVISKDIKEEFSNEHLSRRMETLNEKINNKAAYLDAKLDIKLERIMSKLELIDRDLHNSADDILERLVKGEEKCSFAETEITKQDEKLDEISRHVHETQSYSKEDLTNLINEKFEILNDEVANVRNIVQMKENTSEKVWSDIQTSVSGTRERVLMLLQDSNNKIDNLSASFNHEDRSRISMDLCDMNKAVTQEQIENLTAILEKAMSIGEAKFKELDADVEQYTKKVINGIQELWKTSDELKIDLSHTLEQGSKTRELVRREFQRLHEQIEPLPKLEPKLTDISEDLDKKVVELSTTVDNSFATLLVAQNTFIDSCKRIQQEETHVFDILQQIVYEMRNRSVSDIHRISSELHMQSFQINKSISHVLTAVLLTGNITSNALNDLLSRMKQKEQCVELNANMEQKQMNDEHLRNRFAQNDPLSIMQKDSDIMYDNESDQMNESTMNLNEYEDYQLSEAYYPGNI